MMLCPSRCRSVATWLVVLTATTTTTMMAGVDAYVTSHVPHGRHMAWLKQMTTELTESTKVGELSQQQISAAPELMYAWSHLPPHKSSTEHALAVESLISRLVHERRAGNDRVADLTVQDYNCLLEGWARSGAGDVAADRCEQILNAMQEQGGLVQPNLTSFKAVLMAWRQSSASYNAHRAQRVLHWMMQLVDSQENPHVLPDSDCFDIVLQTWSRSGHKDAPQQAEKLLAAMERLYRATALAQLQPRTLSFNAVLATWARSSQPQAPDRAYSVLKFMEALAQHHPECNVFPDCASYSTVMGALARHGDKAVAARKADTMLKQVEDQYLQTIESKNNQKASASEARSKVRAVAPDTILYNTAMGLWSRANTPRAYRRARSILDRQRRLYHERECSDCRPDVYGYTSVIASCATEQGPSMEKVKAFHVALATYKQVLKEATPNHVTYGAMLKACARLLPAGSPLRRKWTRKIFTQCCAAGYVGDMVVSRFREAAPLDIYKELMQGYTRRTVPQEWMRNVRETNDYRKSKALNRRQRAEV